MSATAEPIQFTARLTTGLRCSAIRIDVVAQTGRVTPCATRRSRPSGMRIVSPYLLKDNYFQRHLKIPRAGPPAAPNPTAEEPIPPIRLFSNSFRPLARSRCTFGSAEGLAPTHNLPETFGPSSCMAGAGGRDDLGPRTLDGPNVCRRNTIRPDARFAGRINSGR